MSCSGIPTSRRSSPITIGPPPHRRHLSPVRGRREGPVRRLRRLGPRRRRRAGGGPPDPLLGLAQHHRPILPPPDVPAPRPHPAPPPPQPPPTRTPAHA